MSTRRALRAAVAAVLLAASGAAAAAGCAIAATPLAFGAYDPLSLLPTDSVGTLTVSCTGFPGETVAYRISIGAGSAGTFGRRTLRSGAGLLDYSLHTDAARSLVWGDGTGGSHVLQDAFALTGSGLSRSYPVYGRIPARQSPPPGLYSDVLVVTLEF